MSISQGFIRKPVATAFLAIGITLIGLVAFVRLPVSALPSVDTPTIQVTAQLPGADPQTMGSSVATPLERQFGQIAGLTAMTSSSGFGNTAITLQFALNRTTDAAAQDVQAAINAAAGQLPKTMPSPPIFRKVNPADVPVLLIALTSDTEPLTKVDDYADSILAQKLSQVPGVSLVTIGGMQKPSIRVQVNPAKLAAAGIDLEQLRSTLGNITVNQPKGVLYGNEQAYTLATNDQVLSAKGYEDLIIAYRNGAPVRLRDIGHAEVAAEDVTLHGWYNDKPSVILAIQRQPGANVISTVDGIKKLLPQLVAGLPSDVKVTIASDRTQTIRASVDDVQFTLLLTIALVVGVIFLFLRNFWATMIPAISVPISLIGTFGVMYLLNYSLDNLSLMGLSIAVGFVVDDAIVMIENISRHIEEGLSPLEAALKGAGEIGFTIISISVSLVAVFIPLLLMGGVIGRMFQEFAVTVCVAIAVSVIVSVTLTPMMCAYLLSDHGAGTGVVSRTLERGFVAIQRGYEAVLSVALRFKLATLTVMLASIVATGALFAGIPKGFFPQQDTGMITGITEASADVSPTEMAELQRSAIDVIAKDPSVANATGYIGPGGPTVTENNGRLFVLLKPRNERQFSADEVIRQLDAKLAKLQGIAVFMQATQDINLASRLSKTQYQFTLTDVNQDELNSWAGKLFEALKKRPELADVASDQANAARQLKLKIDRDAASRLGIDPAAVDNTLYDAFGQRHVAQLFTTLNTYYVILEVDPSFQSGPYALNRIYVRSSNGSMVPLSQFTTIEYGSAALAGNHQNQFPSVTLSFNLAPGTAVGTAVAAVQQETAALHMPSTIATSFQGNAQAFQSALASTPVLILAAIVAVYLILGMLYESTIHPITILSTLPSAGLGALMALWTFGFGLDVIGLIGIILLIGLVQKNGIMLIDFALEAERHRGLSAEQSALEACKVRFRPILMTTMCAMLGGVPLIIGTGTGSELRQPLGFAIVGGLIVSQLLTLFTTPVVYIYLQNVSDWFAGQRTADRSPLPATKPEVAG
ncbi:hydrophobe/amphiphile efflux-1 (HAE1) family protein [Bradyrhizobium japonicum]|jgi:hydrophobe/amphiphile efflux-1 (HAE1) family protein|uniref:Hydrophobe/amphiphile efflux-1 (HAE1) family protein n=1 Tax=Bradyrhizobium elkanii TaxID=29448 RepID=A0ABV4F9Y2_BRAEL|nr:efflux RND transporter permease subunit [Bradyrhizobium elkanii]MBP2432516.1 hydrophobe/amphiphile efflux-1 (HAE1) family protein [Bradyrhizobium elkanii]MCP1734168.1 hydrophobe/amphiphile efflux-1 (HAE1) family protein [Bradyrhizobium elkanii]MCP1751850.1 hydrophobe/amphiphile efflux-1 (HAE1) family protein [Bradyrhizobium elkanii]MCP1977621.1 hydrophobe/amphiphile efflux-1 (HAE1) family protein [Bradyrhizobium elkanii]MCS3569505.1 hydrophobe/amphiphile efflux-1 (HAE1) family protein [Brad